MVRCGSARGAKGGRGKSKGASEAALRPWLRKSGGCLLKGPVQSRTTVIGSSREEDERGRWKVQGKIWGEKERNSSLGLRGGPIKTRALGSIVLA